MERTRSTTYEDTTISCTQRIWGTPSGPPLELMSSTLITEPLKYHFKTITDINIPGFHKKKRKGELIVNPLEIATTKHSWGTFTDLYGTSTLTNGDDESRNEFIGPVSVAKFRAAPDMSVDPDLRDDLMNKATQEVWSQKVDPEFALGVAIAEGRETLSYLLSILQTIRKPLEKLKEEVRRTGQYAGGTSLREVSWGASRELSEIWLSFRYGLMPIYYDIRDFLEADLEYTEKARQTYRRSEKNIETTTDTLISGALYSDTSTKTIELSAHAGLTVDYYWENRIDFLRHVLGLNNPLELLWELTRLSFVVDWFVNIGETISSHTASASVLQEKGWVSFRANIDVTIEAVCEYETLDATRHVKWPQRHASVSNFSIKSMNRILLPDPPYFPQISVNLDGYKFVDLASLVRTMSTL